MDLALYHPSFGYYSRRAPGAGGDYRTAPSLGPWFGRLFARAAERMWVALGRPDGLTVVEVGAGRGDLAAGALGSLPESLAGRVHWVIVERFEVVEVLQRERLGALGGAVSWRRALGSGPPVTGCVLANEVLDNQPVH